jgi:hypothetical protein
MAPPNPVPYSPAPPLIRKTDYHVLARFVPPEALDPEVKDVLDDILTVAKDARPRRD